ncbi:TonB-dependent receptor [Methylococcus sp. EFPC2]|uniref:TonB-dependent siderophore receptor n=1 Tax=Methylococcus sp. EFPC2 TaxID=2812648 RepID=UPI001966E52E|nr:TonB-dependent receptor [Methylococcus sp. EFPC2]QSA96558.1 TonB-dependent receptor [Methylococcus sp. EFPC2]
MYLNRHLGATAGVFICAVNVQAAQTSAQSFNIPVQPLASALDILAKQGNLQLLYADDLVRGKRSPALIGRYLPHEAVGKLLAGSGLDYAQAADGAVSVKPAEGPATLKKVTVTGQYDPDEDPTSYTARKSSSATKSDTPILETPVNIQVVPKAVLDDQQIIQMTQALRNVSGVATSIGSGGLSDDIFLRGFRTSTQFRNGFRIDSGFSSIGTRQMANVERIEVIKGPASVMYGRMEPGGMVNIVTKLPLATPYYALQQQFGSYDLYRTTADATGPLTSDDTLLYRFNASFESSGSFRELVDNERTFLAPVLTWNIGPRTQATLEMEYRHDNLNYDNMTWPYIDGHFIKKSRSSNLMERAPSKVDETLVGLNWSHEFNDDWKLAQRFVVDLRDTDQVWVSAASADLLQGNLLQRTYYRIPGQNDTYYTTMDLTGHIDTWGLKHTLLIGGDFYRTDQKNHPYMAELAPIDIYHPVHDSRLTSPLVTGWEPNDNSADYFGAYAQDQIKLPYGIHVMGGFRYQYVKQWDNRAVQDLISDDAVTPRVGVLWQPQNWISLYGNYVENFGNSNMGAQTATGKPLPPESAQQWETGAKFEFFEGRLSATLAYYDITKQNVVTRDPNDPSGLFSVAAGEVRSQGPEVDIRGEILPGWNVIATYANFDTRVTKDNNGLQGLRLYAVPRNMGSLWSTYDFQDGPLEGLKVGGGVAARDGSTDGSDNGYQTASYATADLLAAYTFKVGKSKLTAQFNVNNLLDKTYFTDAYLGGAATTRSIGTPRSFLGSVKLEF